MSKNSGSNVIAIVMVANFEMKTLHRFFIYVSGLPLATIVSGSNIRVLALKFIVLFGLVFCFF